MSEPAVTPDLKTQGVASAARAEEGAAADKTSRTLIMTAAVICMFMAAIEGTVVATAMPTIVGQLGDFHLFSWVFSIYLLSQSVTVPLAGRFADLFGRKPLIYLGLVLFLGGSAACGLAPSMVTLIAFRVVQGIGAGCVTPVTQTLISDLYPPAARARIQGYLSSIWTVAAVGGPLLGAELVTHLSWRWIFWVNVPIGIAAFVLLSVALREPHQHRAHKIDYLGSLLVTTGIGTLMLALNQATALGTPLFIGLVALALILLAALYFHERVVAEPVLPLQVWRHPIVLAGAVASFTVGAINIATAAFLPPYIQGVMGRDPIVAGYVVAAPLIIWAFGSTVGGRLMLRTSYRFTTRIGSAIIISGTLMLIALTPERGPAWAAIGTSLIGLGMGFFQNTFFVASQSSVGREQRGSATASSLFARILGQSLGSALFGGIVNLGLADTIGADAVDQIMDPALRSHLPADSIAPLMAAVAASLHNVFLGTGVLVLLGFAMTFVLPRGLSPHHAAVDK
ncbi:MAG TPA: MDR family MFS transporter [Stellaceae bacterium]|nr:MDR family MFS transporter [Stellaceae bacterium]